MKMTLTGNQATKGFLYKSFTQCSKNHTIIVGMKNKMHLTKIPLHTALLGRVLPAIACLGILPLHAKDAKFSEIITSEFYKNVKVPTLVEVKLGQKQMDAEKTKIAQKEASRVYKILMKDEMPDLQIDYKKRLTLNGRGKDDLYIRFNYDDDYNLIQVYIGVSNSDAEFSARSEARLSPSKTFQEIFGHPPTGKLRKTNSKSVRGEINGGTVYWKINWPEKVEYEGLYPSSSLRWWESKGKVRTWNISKGMKADFTNKVTDLLQKKPIKINMDQAIAAAYKSVLSLNLSVDVNVDRLPRTQLCYYNLPDIPNHRDQKRWRTKNRPNIDGLSAMLGIHVSFRIPDSFSKVNVIVDHQTGEVLYVGTSKDALP